MTILKAVEAKLKKYFAPDDFVYTTKKTNYLECEITFIDMSSITVVMTEKQYSGLKCSTLWHEIKTISSNGYRVPKYGIDLERAVKNQQKERYLEINRMKKK